MDLTPTEKAAEPADADSDTAQQDAEAGLKRRIVALVDTTTFVVFSYVSQVPF